MKAKFLEWNLNFGGDKKVNVTSEVKEYVKGFDVIMFTETVDNPSVKSLFQNNERKYNIFRSMRDEKGWNNQIVVAVAEEFKAKQIYDDIPNVNMDEAPNFIQIELTIEGRSYQIIGTRIRISSFLTDEDDYKSRKKQFENLVKHIKKYEKVIVLGDFNNGMIKGNSNACYIDMKCIYEKPVRDYKTGKNYKSLLRYYNFHMMKEILGEQFVLEEVTNEPSSWGLSIYNGQFSYGTIMSDNTLKSA